MMKMTLMTMCKQVIVLARNYSTGLGVIRALGEYGFDIYFIGSAYKHGVLDIAASSRYVKKFTEVVTGPAKYGKDEKLLNAILQYAGRFSEKPVLFPTDDYTTLIADMNREELEKYFILPYTMDQSIRRFMDKTVQSSFAREAGLAVPKEWVLSYPNVSIPDDMEYPCFCKPLASVLGAKQDMKKCDNREQLFQYMKMMEECFCEGQVLVQVFLDIQMEIDLSGVCIDQDIYIPGIIKKTAISKYEHGVTMAGELCPFEEAGVDIAKLKAMLRKFHYVGMFDMELNVTSHDIYFGEVNFRSGGPSFVYHLCGTNLPAIAVKGLCGLRITEQETKLASVHKKLVYEKVVWEDYAHNYIKRREKNSLLKSADLTLLKYDNDKEPGRQFAKKIIGIFIRGRARTILDKIKRK